MNELYFYTKPVGTRVGWTLDSGLILQAAGPMTANGRDDAYLVQLPAGTPSGHGAMLHLEYGGPDGTDDFGGRGILTLDPDGGPAHFRFDNYALTPVPAPPTLPDPGPPPPNPDDPLAVITWVYDGGTGVTFDLADHAGCGKFTEACALELSQWNSRAWGHLLKTAGQNQYNGHAVDAIHAFTGTYVGVWDIIFATESPEAKPVFNFAGPVDHSMWAAPFPVPPVQAMRRRVL